MHSSDDNHDSDRSGEAAERKQEDSNDSAENGRAAAAAKKGKKKKNKCKAIACSEPRDLCLRICADRACLCVCKKDDDGSGSDGKSDGACDRCKDRCLNIFNPKRKDKCKKHGGDKGEGREQNIVLSTEEIGGTLGMYYFDGRFIARVKLDYLPHEIVVSRDYRLSYNTVFGNFDYAAAAGDTSGYIVTKTNIRNRCLQGRLYLFDEGSTLTQRAPHGIKFNKDETQLWVNCEYVNAATNSFQCLVVFDLLSHIPHPVATYAFPPTLNLTHNIQFSDNGRYIFLQASTQGMGLYDTLTNTFATVFTPAVGNNIHGINPAGHNLLLVTGLDYAWILNVADPYNPIIVHQYGPFGVGQMIYSSATNDKKYVLLPAPYGQTVLIVKRKTGVVVKRIIPDLNPTTVTISDDSRYAFISPGNGTYIYRVDLWDKTFPVLKIFTQVDAAPNRLALIPDVKFREKRVVKLAVVLPLTGPPVGQGTSYRPIGTVMRNTIAYWQELKNLQGGIYNKPSDRAYRVHITWYDSESSDARFTRLVTKALADPEFAYVVACHPSTSPLTVPLSGKLIGYPFAPVVSTVPYTNNLSYNDWQSLPNLTAAIVKRFNVPVTNEQYTTIGVMTLLGNIMQRYPLDNTSCQNLVGYTIYYFGTTLTLTADRDVVVTVLP